LKDVNIPFLESRILVNIDEILEGLVPEKLNIKPRSKKTIESNQQKLMLQKYKEEKQLKELKEHRKCLIRNI
jgi:hypothetical protein